MIWLECIINSHETYIQWTELQLPSSHQALQQTDLKTQVNKLTGGKVWKDFTTTNIISKTMASTPATPPTVLAIIVSVSMKSWRITIITLTVINYKAHTDCRWRTSCFLHEFIQCDYFFWYDYEGYVTYYPIFFNIRNSNITIHFVNHIARIPIFTRHCEFVCFIAIRYRKSDQATLSCRTDSKGTAKIEIVVKEYSFSDLNISSICSVDGQDNSHCIFLHDYTCNTGV